jgi:hypothetical protein
LRIVDLVGKILDIHRTSVCLVLQFSVPLPVGLCAAKAGDTLSSGHVSSREMRIVFPRLKRCVLVNGFYVDVPSDRDIN